MLVLFETAAGYAIFKLLDNNKLAQSENLYQDFATPQRASELITLKHFYKFEDTTEALSATTAAVEGKLCKSLKKALKTYCETHDQIAVADVKLGNAIKEKLGLNFVSNMAVQELMRGIRSQLDNLLAGVPKKEMTAMRLGLAHSLSRYKLKFSPDKVDTMVIQAVNLLDELDKELNNYIMRCREWYGWHFPELSKIIQDNMAYVKTVQLVGIRDNIVKCDLSDILPEEIEEQVKEAAEISMGTEISEEDAEYTQYLCNEIILLSDYRIQLHDYLKSRMMALAPNLSILVGELVGARLMSHAGSLVNLAKHPASTVQILGAEKALFRALKMKKDTPKYGLIYHANLIGQSSKKNKGKMSRMLAAKASLATRFDALGENTSFDLGVEHKKKLEARLQLLELGNVRKISGTLKAKTKFKKYHSDNEYAQYPTSIDSTLKKDTPSNALVEEIIEGSQQDNEEVDKKKKKKRKRSLMATEDVGESSGVQEVKIETESTEPKKKKKKHSSMIVTEEVEEASAVQEAQVKTEPTDIPKKKKRKHSSMVTTEDTRESFGIQEAQAETESTNLPKKKKKHSLTSTMEMSSGVQVEEDLSSSKKKKKRDVEHKTEDVAGPSGTQELQIDLDISTKKKKKKMKQAPVETESVPDTMKETEKQADISVQFQASETNEGQKKKKKKKKKEKE
ncbi:nucleolar protein 58-like [Odontomachus brunneus]|uniref:nucleolar protein 58-like n=1 Tax=Odontomachus brunneus TaxID=486640 RepID=UPI0013F228DE|nr:nucleolar protein 58-like [Odontomachus brunneus]XP_032685483.1 nucleolar protein 58-like [Odontomachus brunneus]XP_032685485.1 nucleolar protein 58-like [Odontomachus brunneus]